jgi:hypothetical protein
MVDKQGGQNPKTGRKDELKVNLGFYTARLLYDLFEGTCLLIEFVPSNSARQEKSAPALKQPLPLSKKGAILAKIRRLLPKTNKKHCRSVEIRL